jgi:dihydrofolate reductase
VPKHVVTSTLTDLEWSNSRVLEGDLIAGVSALREADDLVAGSATPVQGLVANGLVDELRLMVFPIVLGAGKRVFADARSAATLRLLEPASAADRRRRRPRPDLRPEDRGVSMRL